MAAASRPSAQSSRRRSSDDVVGDRTKLDERADGESSGSDVVLPVRNAMFRRRLRERGSPPPLRFKKPVDQTQAQTEPTPKPQPKRKSVTFAAVSEDGDITYNPDTPLSAEACELQLKAAVEALRNTFNENTDKLSKVWDWLVASYSLQPGPLNFPLWLRDTIGDDELLRACLIAEFGRETLDALWDKSKSSIHHKISSALGLPETFFLALWFGADKIRTPTRETLKVLADALTAEDPNARLSPTRFLRDVYPAMVQNWARRLGYDFVHRPKDRVRSIMARLPFADLSCQTKNRLSLKDLAKIELADAKTEWEKNKEDEAGGVAQDKQDKPDKQEKLDNPNNVVEGDERAAAASLGSRTTETPSRVFGLQGSTSAWTSINSTRSTASTPSTTSTINSATFSSRCEETLLATPVTPMMPMTPLTPPEEDDNVLQTTTGKRRADLLAESPNLKRQRLETMQQTAPAVGDSIIVNCSETDLADIASADGPSDVVSAQTKTQAPVAKTKDAIQRELKIKVHGLGAFDFAEESRPDTATSAAKNAEHVNPTAVDDVAQSDRHPDCPAQQNTPPTGGLCGLNNSVQQQQPCIAAGVHGLPPLPTSTDSAPNIKEATIQDTVIAPAVVQDTTSSLFKLQPQPHPPIAEAPNPSAADAAVSNPVPLTDGPQVPLSVEDIQTAIPNARQSMVEILEKPNAKLTGAIIAHFLSLAATARRGWTALPLPAATRQGIERYRWQQGKHGKFATTLDQALNRQDTLLTCLNTDGGKHWVLAVISPRDRNITAYDSLPAKNRDSLRGVLSDLAPLLLDTSAGEVQIECRPCPTQSDSWSCGVFAVVFALHLAAGLVLPSTINVRLWRLVLLAMAREAPLLSVLPPDEVQVQPAPVCLRAESRVAELVETTSDVRIMVRRAEEAERMARQAREAIQSCRKWFSDRRDDAEDVRRWIDREVWPVFDALAESAAGNALLLRESVEKTIPAEIAVYEDVIRLLEKGQLRDVVDDVDKYKAWVEDLRRREARERLSLDMALAAGSLYRVLAVEGVQGGLDTTVKTYVGEIEVADEYLGRG